MEKSTRKIIRQVLLVGIVAIASFMLARVINYTKPKVRYKAPTISTMTVEVQNVKKSDYQVWIKSYGTVSARTESSLSSEVSGKIVFVSDKLRLGSFFKKNEILLKIDKRDYDVDVIVAESQLEKAKFNLMQEKVKIKNYETIISLSEANLKEAQLKLTEEEARGKLALNNWKNLAKEGEPGDLVLRKPQLTVAMSNLIATKANLEQKRADSSLTDSQLKAANAEVKRAMAELSRKKTDLKRTVIRTPYAGRVKKKYVDIGQFVSRGTLLADIFSADFLEVSIPVTDKQQTFIDLPEGFINNLKPDMEKMPEVRLSLNSGMDGFFWDANIVRTNPVIDIDSRQLFVTALISDPYKKTDEKYKPLKIGQFVEAKIKGKVLKDVFVLKRNLIREGDKVLVVDPAGNLLVRNVNVIWSFDEDVIIDKGLKSGERISITQVPYISSKNPVNVNIKGEKYSKKAGRTD